MVSDLSAEPAPQMEKTRLTASSIRDRLEAAQKALTLTKRLRDAKELRAESSTFGALNIDFVRQTSSKPLGRQTSSSSAISDEFAFGRSISAMSSVQMMAKMKSCTATDKDRLRLALMKSAAKRSGPLARQVTNQSMMSEMSVDPIISRQVTEDSMGLDEAPSPAPEVPEEPEEPEVASFSLRSLMLYRHTEEEESKPEELKSFAASVVTPRPQPTSAAATSTATATPPRAQTPPPTPAVSASADKPRTAPALPPGVFISPKAGGSPYSGLYARMQSGELGRNVSSEGFGGPASPKALEREESWRAPAQEPLSFKPRAKAPLNENEQLKRDVKSLLNKVCPENVTTIVDRITAIKVNDAEQLEIIIESIFRKALAEPHYCETYADLVFSLKSVFPQFPSPHGGKPMTFKSSVLNVCQNEFEELVASAEVADDEKEDEDPDEIEHLRRKRKERMRANMKFIGHLFLRQLLSAKVIGSVIMELVLCTEHTDHVPEDHAIECACELLTNIGYTLEQLPTGHQALQLVCSRLLELKSRKADNGKGVYSKRIVFMIQDLLDTRAAGWSMKIFKSTAKTKEEIRLEQQRDLNAKARGVDSPVAERVVAGQRPVYLSPTGASAQPSTA